MIVFTGKLAEQAPVPAVVPARMQSMPAGELTTRPPPADVTCATTDSIFGTNVAITTRGACIVVWQADCAQSPLNAMKTEVSDGTVSSVTTVPGAKFAVQVPVAAPAFIAQSMPAGEETTEPLPVPLPDTESATRCGVGSVIATGDFEPPPEQAESAATATPAVRTCRVAVAAAERAARRTVRMAERKWSPGEQQVREPVGLAPL